MANVSTSVKKYLDQDGLLYLWQLLKGRFVAKVDGKELSDENFTTELLTKLNGIAENAQVNVLEGVKVNGVVLTIDGNKVVDVTVPTKVSDLTNDASYSKVEASKNNGNIKLNGAEVTVYSLPNATTAVKGGVIVGSNITVSAGTISLNKTNVTNALGFTPYTQAEVNAAIANAGHLKRTVVEGLPAVGEADEHTIYMVLADPDNENSNTYEEYMVINGVWEKMGTSDVDLTPYAKSADIVAITTSEIDEVINQ